METQLAVAVSSRGAGRAALLAKDRMAGLARRLSNISTHPSSGSKGKRPRIVPSLAQGWEGQAS